MPVGKWFSFAEWEWVICLPQRGKRILKAERLGDQSGKSLCSLEMTPTLTDTLSWRQSMALTKTIILVSTEKLSNILTRSLLSVLSAFYFGWLDQHDRDWIKMLASEPLPLLWGIALAVLCRPQCYPLVNSESVEERKFLCHIHAIMKSLTTCNHRDTLFFCFLR